MDARLFERMKIAPLFASALSVLICAALHAEGGFTAEKTASGGVIVTQGSKPFAEYVVDQANKPYLAPVFGADGKQMTRNYPMKTIDGETHDHPHHRGICFGHEDIGGFEFWAEKKSFDEMNEKKAGSGDARLAKLGSTKHREYRAVKADKDSAVIDDVIDWLDPQGKKLLEEDRRMTFRVIDGNRVIDMDQDLIASEGPVRVEDRKDAGLSIRVPTSMAVDSKQGGKIINSEGITDADAWAKRAKWVDYHGPVEGETLGVAMLNHPASFRFPTPWHVRTYGLFTANPFASKGFDKKAEDWGFELKSGEHLKLRHRFLFHTGDEKSAKIAEAWEAYAKEAK
jgi:hypothetical protein